MSRIETRRSSALLTIAALGCSVLLSTLPGSARAQDYEPPDAFDTPPAAPVPPVVGGAVSVHRSVGDFYNVLSPYGSWVQNPTVGWVWVPHRSVVGAGFVPYASNGSWAATDQGWMFNSDFNWGWAPFHYGRWFHDASYGWSWVPGADWAPAWVSWRWGGGYVGWMPLGPVGWAGASQPWVYTPSAYLTYPQPLRYRLRPHLWSNAYRVTRAVGGHYHGRGWHRGPPSTVVRPRYIVRVAAPGRGVLARVQVRGNRAYVARHGSGTVRLRPSRTQGNAGRPRTTHNPRAIPGHRGTQPARSHAPRYGGKQPGYGTRPGYNPGYRGAQPNRNPSRTPRYGGAPQGRGQPRGGGNRGTVNNNRRRQAVPPPARRGAPSGGGGRRRR